LNGSVFYQDVHSESYTSDSTGFKKADVYDLTAISKLIQNNTLSQSENEYTPEQLENWLSENTVEKLITRLEFCELFCLHYQKQLLGVIGLNGSELINLYVHPQHLRQGHGTTLLRKLEAHARAKEVSELSLYATKVGEHFYSSNGFLSQEITEITINGIIYYERRMTKVL